MDNDVIMCHDLAHRTVFGGESSLVPYILLVLKSLKPRISYGWYSAIISIINIVNYCQLVQLSMIFLVVDISILLSLMVYSDVYRSIPPSTRLPVLQRA